MSIDLKQLAARLGLSQTTVSRALNGYSDVSLTTRQRVQQMAAELDYRPNPTARRLARGRVDAVGLVYPLDADDLNDPRFQEVIAGLSDRLETAQVELLLAAAREKSELRTYERLVRGGRVDGLIVARTQVVDARIDYLQQHRIPFVAYGRTAQPADYPWLDFDNDAGMVLAVQALARLGHRSIAYIHAPLTLNFALQRYAGFQRAMQQAGLPLRADTTLACGMTRRAGYTAVAQLLALSPRPTAILVDNNLCGDGALRALLDHRIRIGQDISVLVYDGVPSDALLPGQRIAAIEQPTAYAAGETLADMLLTLIDGGTPDPFQVLRVPVLVDGNSIGPVPRL